MRLRGDCHPIRGNGLGGWRWVRGQTDLPLFPSKPSAVVCLRKPLYARPFRGLVSRRLLGFLRDNIGGFNFGSTSKISDCARG